MPTELCVMLSVILERVRSHWSWKTFRNWFIRIFSKLGNYVDGCSGLSQPDIQKHIDRFFDVYDMLCPTSFLKQHIQRVFRENMFVNRTYRILTCFDFWNLDFGFLISEFWIHKSVFCFLNINKDWCRGFALEITCKQNRYPCFSCLTKSVCVHVLFPDKSNDCKKWIAVADSSRFQVFVFYTSSHTFVDGHLRSTGSQNWWEATNSRSDPIGSCHFQKREKENWTTRGIPKDIQRRRQKNHICLSQKKTSGSWGGQSHRSQCTSK